MDIKGDNQFNSLSDFINKLATIEVRQGQDYKSIGDIQEKLNALPAINEKLVMINMKIEALSHVVTRLEQRDWELEETINGLDKLIGTNTINIADNMKEIKRLYHKIDSTYSDISTKLDLLNDTLKTDYMSHAAFTRLQRNILWAIVSFIGVFIINMLLKYFGVN